MSKIVAFTAVAGLFALAGISTAAEKIVEKAPAALSYKMNSLDGKEVDLSQYRSTSFKYKLARALNKVQLTAFRRIGEIERHWNAPFRRF